MPQNTQSSHINLTMIYFRREVIKSQKTGKKRIAANVYNGYPRVLKNIAIVGVMQKWSDLSDVQKGMITGLRDNNGSISEMAIFFFFL